MIKTWYERCLTHPDHEMGMVTHDMIQARMQEEIEDLRAALAQPKPFNPDWDRVAALEESLREHMAEIHRLKALAQPEQEPVAWRYLEDPWGANEYLITDDPNTAKGPGWTPLYTHPPQRLIAAAPELLDALKKFVAWSKEENHNTGSTFWERVEMLRDLDASASAAITKAEGDK